MSARNSPRSEASQRILNFLDENGMYDRFGDNGYGPDKKYRYIQFDQPVFLLGNPAILAGTIYVYNPKFIQILGAGEDLGVVTFDSVENCLGYIKARWIDNNVEAAEKIPRRQEGK